MDATVNDFLNEINEIAPLSEGKASDYLWEECYDEDSGYFYYWNTKTDEVTWTAPVEYKPMKESIKQTKKPNTLYIPPRTAPLFPSAMLPPVTEPVKIYKISDNLQQSTSQKVTSNDKEIKSNYKKKKNQVSKKPYKASSDSEDEKIVLISSYGGDSESENEESVKNDNKMKNGLGDIAIATKSNFVDATTYSDILTNPQTKNKELSHSTPNSSSLSTQKQDKIKPNKEISGFSLVAGYSDSEEEIENDEIKLVEETKVSHSTLFPITKPIDVKDFTEPLKDDKQNEIVNSDTNFDSKAFQRKRRIGVALINTVKKSKIEQVDYDGNERKGFGFNTENNGNDNNNASGSIYPGFKSGGVMFVKADVLNPENTSEEKTDLNEYKNTKDIEESYTTLKEKLNFLSEGREPVSPVQVMLIQSEILFAALKAGDLKQNYLSKWLSETCSDLIKLEKETTPDGWLLQWDRSHKRYYYQNETTGECQWEYPQPDVTRCDEAMDICTTPPPSSTEQAVNLSPPLPPVIRSPSPPPPPTIGDYNQSSKKKKRDIPLPPEPKETVVVSEKYDSNGEPLPPGVDLPDETEKKGKDDLKNELVSFYSDIAALETSSSPPLNVEIKPELQAENIVESTKKKKKAKVKLAQGIGMKKKGVSKLVEKWKSVQMSYND